MRFWPGQRQLRHTTVAKVLAGSGALIFLVGALVQLCDTRVPEAARNQANPTLLPARDQFYFNLLRDPKTNRIPARIRTRELQHANSISQDQTAVAKSATNRFRWFEAGPTNVGGRTRALAVDIANPNVVIAGGASGGIWKSENRGTTWALKNDSNQSLSVTSIAQDPRPGQTNVWYYASGEFRGISASDRGFRALFYGNGLYKSTDNGESWNKLLATNDEDPTSGDSPFDFLSKVVVSQVTGTLLVSSNQYGIYRSDDYGKSFEFVLGESNQFRYAEIAAASNGNLLASLSSDGLDSRGGIFISEDDGRNWSRVTPIDFPSVHDRSLLTFAPSNPDVAYAFTTFRRRIDADSFEEKNWFHRLDLRNRVSENRTSNLPNIDRFGRLVTQGSYNMTLAVKPDDQDFVVIGGTSLFRSRDGFATPSSLVKEETWIGGYAYDTIQQLALPSYHFPNILYRNSHPDYHITVFDPFDPNTVWTGHDGGISFSTDIDASPVSWDNLNNGYNVTQFYTITISNQAGDNRIMGGTQDNATPFLRWQNSAPEAAVNVGLGDGSYAYFGENYAYISPQRGRIRRLNYDTDFDPIPTGLQEIPVIFPPSPKDRLFIHPFVIDSNNEDVMYFPLQREIWRQDKLSTYPVTEDTVLMGWRQIVDLSLADNYQITTLAISNDPAHLLYFAASSCCDRPLLYRLPGATTDVPQPIRRTLPNAASGAYVHSIAINPTNADEILVVLSNYNVAGLYHSTNGGLTFSVVEGNLEGSVGLPGPSLRSATVLPLGGTTYYFIGTSTGLYATADLSGTNTIWQQQASELIGNTVVESVTSRSSDGVVAVATHGRGLFVGTVQDTNASDVNQPSIALTLGQNYPNPTNPSTSIPFSLSRPGIVTMTLYNVRGREIRQLISGQAMNAGRYEIPVTLSSLSSGMYLYNLQVTSEDERESVISATRKLLLLK